MNEANIDHLLQVSAPRTNWPPLTPVVGRGEHPAFDDHLVYATAPPAPAEPPRSKDTRPPASSPPTDNLPAQRGATPSDVEERDNYVASQTTSSSDAEDESLTSDETEAGAAESVEAKADAADEGAEPTDADEPHDVETDEDGEELVAELAAATDDAAAKFVVVSKSLAREKPDTAGDVAVPPAQDEPAEPNTKQNSAKLGRSTDDGLQPVKSVDTSAATDNVVQAEAAPAQSESEPTAASTPVGARIQIDPGAKQRAAGAAAPSLPAIGRGDLPNTVSMRHRSPVRERQFTGDRPVATGRDETQESNAPPNTEHQIINSEKNSEEPRETEGPRPATSRQAARSESLNNKVNTSVVTAVQGAAVDTVIETTKPDATDEPVRAAAQLAPRSDALLHPLARLQRGGTTVARSHGAAKSEEAPQVDATRFVSRVAKAFHTAQERGGMLQLRLSPPELGALRVELLVQDGVLAAKLEAETPAARRVLLDHLPALRDRLAEQNIRIERFDVDVRQEGNDHSPSSPQHNRHPNQQPHHGSPHRQPTRQPVPTPESATATPAAAGPITDTQINLVA